MCAPFAFATQADILGEPVPANVDEVAASLGQYCNHGAFRGRRDVPLPDEPDHTNPSGDWAATFGAGSALAFRFDGCKGAWHKPGSPVPYQEVLAAMNVTHHLKTTA